MKRAIESTSDFERAAVRVKGERYELRLYVAGATRQSVRAISALRAICEERLAGRYMIEVIDVYKEPERARVDQILAVPTLVRRAPAPVRKLVGDLSDVDRVVRGLELKP